eukprot:CAMPEP_0169289148 /NCGR_PEP_ID=MMETSP1016-20121227/60967_1 /TAXON_ID=342587 /ORGANISM="Karlodinium micrum, Strain CCMP2283" /LENGTH=263 /DNA_ID=CAMNT_0009379483 /DNA_START=176 /DNA_END=967 /DNA_ORIENTATION=+
MEVPQDLRKLLKKVDSEAVGCLDYTTFLAIMIDASVHARKDICRATFSVFDRDGDGAASPQEIAEVLWGRDRKGCIIDGPVVNLIHGADGNGDGKIDFQEFYDMMCNAGTRSPKLRRLERKATEECVLTCERKNVRNAKCKAVLKARARQRRAKKTCKNDKHHKDRVRLTRQFVPSVAGATVGGCDDIANLKDLWSVGVDDVTSSMYGVVEELDEDSDGFFGDSDDFLEEIAENGSACNLSDADDTELEMLLEEDRLCRIVHL